MRHLAVGLMLLVGLAGCSPSAPSAGPTREPGATSAATFLPSAQPPFATTEPTGTVEPPLSTDELASRYLACAKPSNKETEALAALEKKATTLKQLKSIYKSYAGVTGIFIVCVRAIPWPPELARDARDLNKADAKVQVIELAMSEAKSDAEFNSYFRDLDKAIVNSNAAANQIRGDLGLPPPRF